MTGEPGFGPPGEVARSFETERLLIRAPRAGDGQVVFPAILESFDELRPFISWAQTRPTFEKVESDMRRAAMEYDAGEAFMLLLFRKSDGGLVGGCGIHHVRWAVPRCEIGYWARTSMAGQGYISEAVKAVTDFAFVSLGMARVAIECQATNVRSARVAERAGYQLEARLRHFERGWVDGQLVDTLVYGMTRAAWLGRNDRGA